MGHTKACRLKPSFTTKQLFFTTLWAEKNAVKDSKHITNC